MREAVIVSTARTPIGKAYRGAFNNTQGQQLAVYVLTHAGSARRARGKRDRGRLPGCAMPQGSTGSRDSAADRVARGDTDLVGRHRPGTREQARRVSAHRRDPPRPRGTSHSPAKTKKVLEGSLRQTALLGHEEIGTDHLLLALLDDPASTGAQILTDLASLPISEMREHLRRELAQQAHPRPRPPHPHPAQRRRIHPRPRCRPHPGQNLETSGPRPAEEPRQQIGGDAQRNPPTLPRPRPPDPKSPYSLGRGFKCYAAALTVIST